MNTVFQTFGEVLDPDNRHGRNLGLVSSVFLMKIPAESHVGEEAIKSINKAKELMDMLDPHPTVQCLLRNAVLTHILILLNG